MRKCPNCAEEIQEEDIFCRYCGSSLEKKKKTQKTKKCPWCASKNQAEAIICRFCGSSLEKKKKSQKIKKCPYCAEEIQEEDIFCRYCKSNLTKIPYENKKEVVSRQVIDPELKTSNVFLSFIFIILTVWAIALLALFFSPNDPELFGGIINLIARIMIGSWAVKDRSFSKEFSGLQKFLVFILAFIPIGSWFAIFYASRHIARNKKTGLLVFVGSLLIGLTILLFFAI